MTVLSFSKNCKLIDVNLLDATAEISRSNTWDIQNLGWHAQFAAAAANVRQSRGEGTPGKPPLTACNNLTDTSCVV